MIYQTEDQIRQELRDSCRGMLQKDRAAQLGFSQQYLTDLIHGKRQISEEIANKLGYTRKVIFIKESTDE